MSEKSKHSFLERAVSDGHAKIVGEGKTERIHYLAADHTERWADPEEKVRAEIWAELIYKYEYRPERMRFEVKVPRRTSNDLADLVIFGDKDDELKAPYLVLECKRADVSDAEFAQSIEQACGNRANLAAPFCGAVAGITRRFLRFDDPKEYPPGERDANIIADVPVRYGKPPAWRFYKGGFRLEKGARVAASDLPAVPREALRSAIRKCHQTLWEGGRRSQIIAFGEFCKIVFVKHRDEKNQDREDGQPYVFQRGDETAEHLSTRIHRLYQHEQELEPDVFTDKINVEPLILAQVVEHLEGISLDRTELDTKGVAFEEFMGE